ncbi:hypothetical protein MWH28_11830 [Natroniella sulfidigena]|uniref:hypothetical protein n=1 Tax=Natroniella sulfidigena TaxID=723921 RepID=UPI00200A19D4|nr:hypothetical protein [Natroniella sulfidigena]MCK8818047.1 hypothetical protein [Natroniella sulfidigena]
MGKWICTKCGWSGNDLALLKIKEIGYFKLYKGCLECKADIDKIELASDYSWKQNKQISD